MNFYQKFILPKLLNSAMGGEEFEKLRSGVIHHASGIVLEIGIGAGHNIPFYKNVSKLYALEPSKELSDIAKERASRASFRVHFLNTSAEHIPLPNGSVDTVVSTWTLCSVKDPAEVLKEIKRVLRPEGTFVFIDHGISPKPLIRMVQHILTPFTKYFTGNCHLTRDIERLVQEAGFSFQKLEQFQEGSKPLVYNNKGISYILN